MDKDTTEYFDGQSWKDGLTLPYKMREAKVVKVSETEGFLFGGVKNGVHNYETHIVNFETGVLTAKAPIPIGSTIHGAGSFMKNGKPFVASVGGYQA